MSPNQNSKILFSLCLGALWSAQLLAQMTVTGSVSGIVVDPTGKTVPAAGCDRRRSPAATGR